MTVEGWKRTNIRIASDPKEQTMNRGTVGWAILVMGIGLYLLPQAALGQAAAVTGAGAAVLPSGAAFNGVTLSGLRFGIGVSIASNGGASGDFESTLLGTSVGGQPQTIAVVGKPTSGSLPSSGRATFSGLCRINMGDGTPALTNVPFTATAVAGAGAAESLTLTLGTTNLPAATGTNGRINVVR